MFFSKVYAGVCKLSPYERYLILKWVALEILAFLAAIVFICAGIWIVGTPTAFCENVLMSMMFYFLCGAMAFFGFDRYYNFFRRGMFVYTYKDVRTIIHLARIFRTDSHIPIYFRTKSGSYMFYSDTYDYSYNTTFVITREENDICGLTVYEFLLVMNGRRLPECKVKWYDKESGKHRYKYISSNEAFRCIFPQQFSF